MELWLFRLAGVVAGLLVILLVAKLIRSKPCRFVGCTRRMKHLSIEKRYWLDGKCPRNNPQYVESFRHRTHLLGDGKGIACYVTKWICKDCGEMGIFCAGDENQGAWTVLHGEIVPDEKHWAQWTEPKKDV